VIDDFSVRSDGAEEGELTRESLLFLSTTGLVDTNETLRVSKSVDNEREFKIRLLEAIHTHADTYIRYFSDVIRDVYQIGKNIGNRELLNALRKVRREAELSDETSSDTGKFENLKPLIDYLGLLGKYSIGRKVVYIQTLDPELLLGFLKSYQTGIVDIQVAEFVVWLDQSFIPAVDKIGEPYNSVKNSFLSAETMGLVRMDRPADWPVLNIERKVSRVRVI